MIAREIFSDLYLDNHLIKYDAVYQKQIHSSVKMKMSCCPEQKYTTTSDLLKYQTLTILKALLSAWAKELFVVISSGV